MAKTEYILLTGISTGQAVWLVILGIIIVLAVTAYIAYVKIRDKVRRFSSAAFGTSDLTKGLQRQADEAANTPRSVASMTRLMEPQIARDFPEFSWPEFKHKAENMLVSALQAVAAANIGLLKEASPEVHNQIENIIEGNRIQQVKEHYSNIHIHQTEISNYRKADGKCVVTIQSAVEYYHYKEKEGRIIEGERERKVQTRYNMELVYIQDEKLAGTNNALGAKCPNCGAPVTVLGNKFCEYCGAGLEVFSTRVWSLHKYYEVDYNHI